MLITQARLISVKKLKTMIKLSFQIPLTTDTIQLLQSVKLHGYLAFNPDKFKEEVEKIMRDTSIGMNDKGKSMSYIERGVLYQIWLESDSKKTFKEFYQDKKRQDIDHLKKYYQKQINK